MPLAALILLTAAAQVGPNTITVKAHNWAPFISPMGEPFRARTTADDTLADWFYRADRSHDGVLTADEMQADADRFFASLDTDHNGEIDPDELVHYEWEVAPDIQVNSRKRRAPGEPAAKLRPGDSDEFGLAKGPERGSRRPKDDDVQGAARYGLLNIPEPVAAADTNFDRGISLAEFRAAAAARFQLLDTARQGRISLGQLETLRATLMARQGKKKKEEDALDPRVGNPLPPGN